MSQLLELRRTTPRYEGNGTIYPVAFAEDDPVFAGHFPGYPVLPASFLVDLCCDCLALSLGQDHLQDGEWCVARSVFSSPLRPGDRTEIMVSPGRDDAHRDIRVTCKGEVAATLGLRRAEPADVPALPIRDTADMVAAGPYLPQRFPLQAVDLLSTADDDNPEGHGRKLVSHADYFFRRAATCAPSYPHGAVIEGIEQAAATVLARQWDVTSEDNAIVIGGLNGIRFHGKAAPGEVIDLICAAEQISDDFAMLTGRAQVDSRALVTIDRIIVIRKELNA